MATAATIEAKELETQALLLRFRQVALRVFEGPQGVELQDFIELHDPETSLCHLGVQQGTSKKGGSRLTPSSKKYVVLADAGNGKGPAQNLSETYVLSNEGQRALNLGLGTAPVFSLRLRCNGGYFRGDSKGSGANCMKIAAEEGWCSSMGNEGCPPDCLLSPSSLNHSVGCSRGRADTRTIKCDDPKCTVDKDRKKQDKESIRHGCGFTVTVEADLQLMSQGLRRISITGRHVSLEDTWVPPSSHRLCRHARAILKRTAPVAHKGGRTAVLDVVTSASQGGVGVADIKETLPHKQMSRHLEHLSKQGRGHKTGVYDRVNDALRSNFLLKNVEKAASGAPFLLYFGLGLGSDMQIVVSTSRALLQHTRYGLKTGVTDSRWTGGADTKTCHTALHCRDEKGRCVPTVASLSSGESAATLAIIMESIEGCRPCGPDGCNHPIVKKTETATTITFTRDCPAKEKASPTCNIDKDSSAKSALVAAGGAQPPVDTFHHKVAFSAKLKEYGVPEGAVSAAINRLHNVTLRAQTQQLKDASIDQLLSFIRTWNASQEEKFDPVILGSLERYIRMSLGYTGSQWQGCIGDMAVKSLGGNTSTGGAESHFSSYLALVSNGKTESDIVKLVLNTYLGVKENGLETGNPNYWSIFERAYDEKSGSAITSTERLRRQMEGTRLTIAATVPEDMCPVVIQVAEGGDDYLVRRGVRPSIMSAASVLARKSAENGEVRAAVDPLAALFDFEAAERLNVLPGTPSRVGYTCWNTKLRTCSNCPDHNNRGSTTDECKHGQCVRIHKLPAAEKIAQQERFYTFLQNRERTNIPEARNKTLYNGSYNEVNSYLQGGGSSSWRSTPVASSSSSSSSEAQLVVSHFLVVRLGDLLEHCNLLPHAEDPSDFYVTSFLQEESYAFFGKLGLQDETGGQISGGRLSVLDTLTAPPGETSLGIVLAAYNGDPSEVVTLLVKTARELRRKSTSHGAQLERDTGARVAGNGRNYRRIADTTCLQDADASRPVNVQMSRVGRNQKSARTHRQKRAGTPSVPPFAPNGTAQQETLLTGQSDCVENKKARQSNPEPSSGSSTSGIRTSGIECDARTATYRPPRTHRTSLFFYAGQKVRARWSGQLDWFEGEVTDVHFGVTSSSCSTITTVDIKYNDGDNESYVPVDLVQPLL